MNQSYWNNNGKHQIRYRSWLYFSKLPMIPFSVNPETLNNLSAILVASNVYYDIYNNGGCNLTSGGSRRQDWKNFLQCVPSDIRASLKAVFKNYRRNPGAYLATMEEVLESALDWILEQAGVPPTEDFPKYHRRPGSANSLLKHPVYDALTEIQFTSIVNTAQAQVRQVWKAGRGNAPLIREYVGPIDGCIKKAGAWAYETMELVVSGKWEEHKLRLSSAVG